MNRMTLVVVAVLVVAGLAVAAALTTPGDAPAGGGGQVAATPTIVGDPLPVPAEGSDPAVGLEAPGVTGADFSGRRLQLAPRGEPTIVVFLAHWCPHCQREVPVVQQWLDAGGLPAGVRLATVVTAIDPDRDNHPPDAWLEREGWTPPVLVDDDSVAAAYGVSAFPFWVVLDADGRVLARLSGELTPAELDELVGLVT